MRVLLLGARGMLGSMLREIFSDWDVVAWDREELDVTNECQVREKVITLRQAQGDDDFIIINATVYANVDGAEDLANRDICFAVNEKAVKYLAEASKELDVPLVHYSTDYVFPGNKKAGYSEDDAPGPAVNVYGQAKLAGERALKESGAKFYLIRTAWLYGFNGKNFVDTMLKLGKEQDLIEVVSDQHGSPTFTKDVALATREIIESHYPFGIYHRVNFGETTWYDFARKIFEIEKMNIEVVPVSSDQFPRPAKRPKYSLLRNTRGPTLRHWNDALVDYLTSKRGTVL